MEMATGRDNLLSLHYHCKTKKNFNGHFKTVVRTGVLGINYWIEVRMEREEEHLGRQMEAKKTVKVSGGGGGRGWGGVKVWFRFNSHWGNAHLASVAFV